MNWKGFLKALGVAAGGMAVATAQNWVPAVASTKYGPAVVFGLGLAGAYMAKSPFGQQILNAAQQFQAPAQPAPEVPAPPAPPANVPYTKGA